MIFESMPIWAVFIVIVLIVMLSIEAGYRLGQFSRKSSQEEKESPVSVISGSILALGAFILAFTFGIVANRYDARKELVRDEANAIRTAWLRSDFLPEADRAKSKALLRQYLDARLEFTRSGDKESTDVKAFRADVDRAQALIWEIAVANTQKGMNSDYASLYIESLNKLFTIHALRVAVGLQVRIPLGIWFMLLTLTLLGMMSVGYQTGIAGSKRSLARPILAIAFALVISLIAELDRQGSTFIRVTQQPLVDVQTWISESTAP